MEENKELLDLLVQMLLEVYGNSIRSIFLYGSVARGTYTEESDIDVAVIIEKYTKQMHDEMNDRIVDLELEYNKVLSVLLIDKDKYNKWIDVVPFYQNVQNEGVYLWKAA